MAWLRTHLEGMCDAMFNMPISPCSTRKIELIRTDSGEKTYVLMEG